MTHILTSERPWQLSRRHALRGIGALVGLPLLEAMAKPTGAYAAGRKGDGGPPVRMACLFMPNGVNGREWQPKGEGAKWDLSPTLAPLAGVKDDINVISGLWNKASRGGDGHYVKTSGWLTSTTITKTTGKDLNAGGSSMDQVAAGQVGHLTRLPSLELGCEPVTTGIDTNVNYTRLYGSYISWKTPTIPLACEINPKQAFDRLFRTTPTAAGDDQSVLDLVLEDAKRLREKVGRGDQQKLDEYLEAVRAVEKQIAHEAQEKAGEALANPRVLKAIAALGQRIESYYTNPENANELNTMRRGDHTGQVRLMLDIILLSFWSNTTRVSTFMFGNSVSGKNFSFLDGVKGGHHDISHHKNDAGQLAQYQRINQWHVEQYAYLLERMKQVQEGEGTLLDHSMVLFGSGFRDGNAHDPHNVPLVLGGKAKGTIKTGRHLAYPNDSPLANLWVSMLRRTGADIDRFADSTGELKNLG